MGLNEIGAADKEQIQSRSGQWLAA